MTTRAASLAFLLATPICVALFGAADAAAVNGPVVGWGSNGALAPPDSVNGVLGTASAIAPGLSHICAIQGGTGSVVCWGDDGQATPPGAVDGVSGSATAIAAGGSHTLAIAVPEPSALLSYLSGLALLCALQRSRARKCSKHTVPDTCL
jgi:hypothetical protein